MNNLKELVAKAHKYHLKVLLDIVAHHVHIQHPFYKNHPEWFGTLDLPDGRKNLRLWDEQRQKLVGFGHLRALRRQQRRATPG